jgi:hypothetical protein
MSRDIWIFRKNSSAQKLIGLFVLPLCFLVSLGPLAATQKEKPTKEDIQMKKSLEATEEKFVQIIRDKNASALSAEISKQGVVPSTDSDRIPLEKVKDDLAHDGVFYCQLFDSECIHRTPANPKQVSVRDILLKAKSIKRQISVDKQDDTILGDVTLFAVGKPEAGSRGEEFCHIVYIYENSEWKIYTFESR